MIYGVVAAFRAISVLKSLEGAASAAWASCRCRPPSSNVWAVSMRCFDDVSRVSCIPIPVMPSLHECQAGKLTSAACCETHLQGLLLPISMHIILQRLLKMDWQLPFADG